MRREYWAWDVVLQRHVLAAWGNVGGRFFEEMWKEMTRPCSG